MLIIITGNINKHNGNSTTFDRPNTLCSSSNLLVRLPQYSQDRKSFSDVDTDEDCSEVDVIGDDKGYLS